MSDAEKFRQQLQERTPEAIEAVRWLAMTSQDPRIQREAHEYLNG
jgi:hypothetical protein